MNYTTVYEIESTFFPYLILIPIAFLLLFAFLYYKFLKLRQKNILRFVFPFCIVLMLFLCVANVYGYIDLKTNVIEPYFNGEYQETEGTVTDFYPLPLHGKGTESFRVNGIKFSYSKSSIEYIGYNKVSSEGGYINKSGQKVRIRYYYDDIYATNVILKLEVSSSRDNNSNSQGEL